MKKWSHNKGTYITLIKPETASQVAFSDSGSVSLDLTLGSDGFRFSEETIDAVSKLGDVLRRIDRRMKRDGFCIKNGKIVRDENI